MKKNILLSIGGAGNKKALLPYIKKIPHEFFILYATEHTAEFLTQNKIPNQLLHKVSNGKVPNIAEFLIRNKFDAVINIPSGKDAVQNDVEETDGYYIRKKTVENKRILITDCETAVIYLKSLAKNLMLSGFKRQKRGFSAKFSEYAPTYDINKSYDFNYDFGPFFDHPFPPRRTKLKKCRFLGIDVNSLFGVPAGPLLNSRWVKTYADLGYDILTYKTVRTVNKACQRPPNIIFIDPHRDYNYDIKKPAYSSKRLLVPYAQMSITNSFGVPSKEPDVWMEDVKLLLPQLKKGQLLILSVMGSLEEGMLEKEYVEDFVECALLAKATGVRVIEVNLSCPNLGTGAIFNDISLSKKILMNVKKAIKPTLLLAKIGYFNNLKVLREFVKQTHRYLDGYVAINTVPKKVLYIDGEQALPGKNRAISGTCGALIKKAGMQVVLSLAKIRKNTKWNYQIIAVGGVMCSDDYFDYRNAGADAVLSATGAMWNPYLAYQIKKALSRRRK